MRWRKAWPGVLSRAMLLVAVGGGVSSGSSLAGAGGEPSAPARHPWSGPRSGRRPGPQRLRSHAPAHTPYGVVIDAYGRVWIDQVGVTSGTGQGAGPPASHSRPRRPHESRQGSTARVGHPGG